MKLKKLLFTFSFVIFLFSRGNTQETTRDTVAFSEANTEKVLEFGNFMSNAIHAEDADLFLTKLNKNLFFDRILSHHSTRDRDDPFVKGFLKGMDDALSSFPNEIITDVANGSYYDFISYRYDEDAQTYYALFRLYSNESGMNYHDYRIQKVQDEIQFSDMYIYLSGEHFTETLGRMLSYSLPKDQISSVEKTPRDRDVKDLYKAFIYNSNGDYRKAYNIINGIKSSLGKEKFLLIFKSLVASNLGDKEYLKSLEDIINTFPNDPTIYLNKIDYLIYKEEYFEAIQVINSLQNETEDDFLNYLKACVAFEDKNYDLALNLFKYTIDNYTDFFEGQAGYLNTLVMMEDYGEAVTYLDTLVAEGYEKPLLIEYVEENDEFGKNILEVFSKSPEFKTWKKIKN